MHHDDSGVEIESSMTEDAKSPIKIEQVTKHEQKHSRQQVVATTFLEDTSSGFDSTHQLKFGVTPPANELKRVAPQPNPSTAAAQQDYQGQNASNLQQKFQNPLTSQNVPQGIKNFKINAVKRSSKI